MPKELDITQISQMVKWLDEERKKDKEERARLMQQVAGLMGGLEEQTARVQQLEFELSSVQGQLPKLKQIEEALNQVKNELGLTLKDYREDLLEEVHESEKLYRGDLERLSQQVALMQKDINAFHSIGLKEWMKTREAEESRLNDIIIELKHQYEDMKSETEEKVRPLSFLSERIEQDHKRISKTQGEIIALQKAIGELKSRYPLLSEQIERQQKSSEELKLAVEKINKDHKEFIERVNLRETARDKKIADWEQEWNEIERKIGKFQEQIEQFAVAHREMLKVMDTMEEFKEEIRRGLNQVSELQRIAEERQRKELSEFKDENDRTWHKHLITLESQWNSQNKVNQELKEALRSVEKELQVHMDLMQVLRDAQTTIIAQIELASKKWAGEMKQVKLNWEKIRKEG